MEVILQLLRHFIYGTHAPLDFGISGWGWLEHIPHIWKDNYISDLPRHEATVSTMGPVA